MTPNDNIRDLCDMLCTDNQLDSYRMPLRGTNEACRDMLRILLPADMAPRKLEAVLELKGHNPQIIRLAMSYLVDRGIIRAKGATDIVLMKRARVFINDESSLVLFP